MRPRHALLAALPAILVACAVSDGASNGPRHESSDVILDTRTERARAQYDANVAFANAYRPRCLRTQSGNPRVLVTGFGRFMRVLDNATGRILSTLVPDARYPETAPAPEGTIDDPDAQLSVATTTLTLPSGTTADVCAVILPVYWDLAPILVAKELEAFDPSFVLMNGVAGDRQPLWIELGSLNRAAALDDGSERLRPITEDAGLTKIIDETTPEEDAQPNLLSWNAVEQAARVALKKHAGNIENDTRLSDILHGVTFGGFPRQSNTYLCNDITFVTGYLMSHPQTRVRLLRASPPLADRPNEVDVELRRELRAVPRVFVHWPADMAAKHHAAGAAIMRAMIDAQLGALARGDLPTLGTNDRSDAPNLAAGKHF